MLLADSVATRLAFCDLLALDNFLVILASFRR